MNIIWSMFVLNTDPFIKAILSSAEPLPTQNSIEFVELGCGAGNITKILREYVPNAKFTLFDSCPKMLSLAVENNPTDNSKFYCADITKRYCISTSSKSVVHSHGVLEHFNNSEIYRIIDLASKTSDFQIHYVPSDSYEKPSRGDERLMSVHQWELILSRLPKTLNFEISKFNNWYDLIIKIIRKT